MKSGAMFSPILLQLLLLKTMESRSTHSQETKEYDYNDYYDNLESAVIEDEDNKSRNSTNEINLPKIFPPPNLSKLNIPPNLPVSKNVKSTLQLTDENSKEAPDYMMDLYKRFSNNHISHPSSNIVRSFMNINIEEPTKKPTEKNGMGGQQTRVHTMVFNITSISLEEKIDLAELRLYTLVERDQFMYIGVDRKVSVYEVKGENNEYHLIDSKHIYGRDSGWETFDVTSAVERWIQQVSSVQVLEIRIESVFHSVSLGDLDILTQPKNKKEPLLVVFSSDENNKRLHMNERHELVTHEMDSYDVQQPLDIDINDTSVIPNEVVTLHNRIKRRGRRYGVCRRRPMYVSFKDINWDSWIIAPHGYQAYECTGRCYFPLSDHLSPTKHAIIQSLLHTTAPRRISRACCVPTKLDPISILYIDEQNVITYKYRYDGMIVSQCGCR